MNREDVSGSRMRRVRAITAAVLLVYTLLAVVSPAYVLAATITANIFTDPTPGDCAISGMGNCSLREAVIFANANPNTTINLLPGTYALTISPSGSDDAGTGDLNITAQTTIYGAGQGVTIIDASGMTPTRDRVFNNSSLGSPSVIAGLTIRGGEADNGGGITNGGILTVADSTISGNHSTFPYGVTGGGGIYNNGTLLLLRTVLSDNIADATGGGIVNYGGKLTLESSTVSGNTALIASGSTGGGGISNVTNYSNFDFVVSNSLVANNRSNANGGGINIYGGSMIMTNSTISGNSATYTGAIALVSAPSTINILSSTISNNSSGLGLYYTSFTMRKTLLADNGGKNCLAAYPSDTHDYNLSNDASCRGGLIGPHDLNGAFARIGPLADNGGPTKTHALLPGSAAIDAGGPTATGCPAKDQRGVTRPQGGACDIGAFESAPIPLAIRTLSPAHGEFVGGTRVILRGTNFQSGMSVLFDGLPATNVTLFDMQTLTAVTPAHAPATVDVTIRTPDGQSTTLTRGFTYDTAPPPTPRPGGLQAPGAPPPNPPSRAQSGASGAAPAPLPPTR